MIPVAYGVAAVSTLFLLVHLARRYPSVPKRVPMNIRPDGRPSERTAGKLVLWVAPAIIVVVLALLGVLALVQPPAENQRVIIALVFVTVAEVAWYAAWSIDRQIEMARKMTYRVAPTRLLRALVPLILTVAVTVFVAARS